MNERMRLDGWRLFWLCNGAALLAACGVFPLMLLLARRVGGLFRFCPLHDLLHIYCVTCGGTRATWQLIHGQFAAALRSNAAVVGVYATLLAIDVRGLIVLLRGGKHPFRLPRAFWFTLLAAVLGYALVRDVCLLAFRWDWVGDFIR